MLKKMNVSDALEKRMQEWGAEKVRPRLLLHACCAPCASYVLEYLRGVFDITVFFCNPNITDPAEYRKRLEELKRLIPLMEREHPIRLAEGPHDPAAFLSLAEGREELPEGGARCFDCYRLRLEATASYMAAHRADYDYFATTLTVSPHKNAAKLNEIGEALAGAYGTPYLPSDFKKREGYKRSIELSREFDLYRQDFCGCEYSRRVKHGQ